MQNLTIELPDELARSLAGIAAGEHKTLEQLAVERLRSLVEPGPHERPGSADAILRAVKRPPHLSSADLDELDAAIAAGRLPATTGKLFEG